MEYGIDFVRIENLKEDDLFLYMGLWRRVKRINGKKLVYSDEYSENKNKRTGEVSRNKQFVEISKIIKPSATS
jgi:hypothetical protein